MRRPTEPYGEEKQADRGRRIAREPALRQLGTSALGEVAAFSVAIGAVYVTERLFPEQTKAFVSTIAKHLGEWRGLAPETQTGLAHRIVDAGVMNVAGASSLAVQFGLRRSRQTEEQKTSSWYEAGRLATGRIAGTVTAIGALTATGIKAPGMLKKMESGISKELGSTMRTDRFAELVISNLVQSVGATLGNAPAQLLYDHVMNTHRRGNKL